MLLKILAPKPDDRYNNAAEMVEALKDGFGPAPADVTMNTVLSGMVVPKTATPPAEATETSCPNRLQPARR